MISSAETFLVSNTMSLILSFAIFFKELSPHMSLFISNSLKNLLFAFLVSRIKSAC